MDWQGKLRASAAAYESRRQALDRGDESEERPDLRVSAVATAAWSAGLAALMLGRDEEARDWLRRAAAAYRESWLVAPPGSWGRPVAVLRCDLLADDGEAAAADAESTIAAGAADAESVVAWYAAALALFVLARDAEAGEHARRLVAAAAFEPRAVADALVSLAERNPERYASAAAAVLRSFEERASFLEDTPVADTVLVLDRLAAARALARPPLRSPLLPR